MTKVFEWPLAAPGTKPLQRPTMTLDPRGFFEWGSGQVAWCPKRQALVLTDTATGKVLHEVAAPRGKRKKLRAKMWELAEELAEVKAGGARKERALRRAGL